MLSMVIAWLKSCVSLLFTGPEEARQATTQAAPPAPAPARKLPDQWEIERAQTRAVLIADCRFFGLDPETSTIHDVDRARHRWYVRREAKYFGLDPEKATIHDVDRARHVWYLERMAKRLGLV